MDDLYPCLATVVVATRGDVRVRRLIASLEKQTMPLNRFEVVVVENGSRDLADISSTSIQLRYFCLADANMASARNLGLRVARGKYLLLTDADCVAHAQWVEKLIASLADGTFQAIGGRIDRYQPQSHVQKYGSNIVDGQRQPSFLPALNLPYVAGANCGFCKEALLKTSGFDASFKSGNDVDICYQLGLKGFRIGTVTDAVIYHDNRQSVAAHFARFLNYSVYQVLLFKKYRNYSGRRFCFNTYPFVLIARALKRLPRALFYGARGDFSLMWICALQIVEALGVFCGDVIGAVRYRQLYI